MGEQPVGDDGEQDEAAGDHRLDERDRREREGGDVEAPGADRDDDPEHVPAVAEQRQRGADRPPPLDRRRARPRRGACRGSRRSAKNAVATAISRPIWTETLMREAGRLATAACARRTDCDGRIRRRRSGGRSAASSVGSVRPRGRRSQLVVEPDRRGSRARRAASRAPRRITPDVRSSCRSRRAASAARCG